MVEVNSDSEFQSARISRNCFKKEIFSTQSWKAVLIIFFSDTWTSSLNKSGSGHFKKQWLMKNTEETKEVPDVDEIVREELRNEFIFFWSNKSLLKWDASSRQGWKNTNTYWANTGVRSCSPEHERTRTRIFQKLLNTNEHELGKFINYRTRTNTNTKLKVGEQRTRNRTPNTWTPNVFAPVRRVRRFKTVRTFRRSDCVKSPRFAQIYSWNPKCSLFSLLTMFDLVNSCC